MARPYSEFRNDVKEGLRESLAVWKLTDEQLEAYVQKEEDQIKDAYGYYLKPKETDTRDEEARYASGVSTVSMCLEYCYE